MLPPSIRRKYRRFARSLPVDPLTVAAVVAGFFVANDHFAEEGGVIAWAKSKLGL